jgi:hypothetical protein
VGLLDRFSNPIWHKISKLDKNQQCILAAFICPYDFLRQSVKQELVSPLQSFLKESGIVATTGSISLTPELTAQLVEEALLGLLRCCSCPAADPGGRLTSTMVQGLPEMWGTFVLADINHRLNRSSPNVLEETHYSKDPDEARTQVLIRWMEILGVKSPSFVPQVNANGFAAAWSGSVESFVSGMLKGTSRVPEEVLLARARRDAAAIPAHRAALIEYIIGRLRTAPATH